MAGFKGKPRKVFQDPYQADIEALLDEECTRTGGYILKKFTDGYRYYPLGYRLSYIVKCKKIIEIGHLIGTYHLGSKRSKNSFN